VRNTWEFYRKFIRDIAVNARAGAANQRPKQFNAASLPASARPAIAARLTLKHQRALQDC